MPVFNAASWPTSAKTGQEEDENGMTFQRKTLQASDNEAHKSFATSACLARARDKARENHECFSPITRSTSELFSERIDFDGAKATFGPR
jgi:hypothetical protein